MSRKVGYKYIEEDMRVIAMRDLSHQWWKVDKNCVQCGDCCADMKGVLFPGVEQWVQEDGTCKFLAPEHDGKRPCLLYPARPHATCTHNNPHTMTAYCKMVIIEITVGEAVDLLLRTRK
jgi:hypothetical protein